MYRKILVMLITSSAFGVAVPGFAQSLNTFDEDAPDIRVDAWPEESQDRAATETTGGWVIEKNAEDAYPEMRSKSRTTESSNRYANPHPELGCLYYDENDKRHWFPGCRDL